MEDSMVMLFCRSMASSFSAVHIRTCLALQRLLMHSMADEMKKTHHSLPLCYSLLLGQGHPRRALPHPSIAHPRPCAPQLHSCLLQVRSRAGSPFCEHTHNQLHKNYCTTVSVCAEEIRLHHGRITNLPMWNDAGRNQDLTFPQIL
jgi:hypothetical protein